MEDAFDTIRGVRVSAQEAENSDFPDRYLCPICRTEVVHVSPSYYASHFKHRIGTDHEKCERYSAGFHREVPLSRHEFEHFDAALVARITATNEVAVAIRFRPAFEAKHATLLAGAKRIDYTIHVGLKQQYFSITTAEDFYTVLSTSDGGSQVVIKVDGFEKPAVFLATEAGSVRIPSHRVLRPGRYVAITRSRCDDCLPPILNAIACEAVKGLSACVFEIPHDPNETVRSAIRSLFGFECAASWIEYAFLAPFDVSEIGQDCWEVGNTQPTAVRLRFSRALCPPRRTLLFQVRKNGVLGCKEVELADDADDVLVCATGDVSGIELVRIALLKPLRFILEIRYSEDRDIPFFEKLSFEANGQARHWSARTFPELIRGIVRGSVKVLYASIPRGVTVAVSDSLGRRFEVERNSTNAELVDICRRTSRLVIQATGHRNWAFSLGSAPTEPAPIATRHSIRPGMTRLGLRLHDAYRRGYVGEYSLRGR